MRKGDLLRRKVEDIDLARARDVAALVAEMDRGGGFTAKKIAEGVGRSGSSAAVAPTDMGKLMPLPRP